jgi:RND family efflux transporter MFP subunit
MWIVQNQNGSSWWRGFYERHRRNLWVAQAIGLFLLGGAVVWLLSGPGEQPPQNLEVTKVAAETGVSLWTCSMHPQIRQPNPGDCPICGMDLIPVATSTGGLRTLAVSPEARALMNIAAARVERRYVQHEIRMVGKVDFDETKRRYISAWVPGRLDRLYVDYAGVQVKEGDHLVYIYSPELYAAQQELIQARKYRSQQDASGNRFVNPVDMVESAREKLRLLGLAEEQIQKIEQQERPSDHLTINSPVSGIVIEKLKQEGDYVRTGERIYTVADLNQVWVHLDAYETDLSWIRYGQDVTITTEAYPGEEFHGRIAFIQPVLNDRTRTVKARVNVPNPDGKLKPDMFVHAVVRPQVAAAGRVLDPSLAGKWISPMHPEIVKDEPGTCDICGMPLVRAETLGYVAPETDESSPPLVIPYSAALVTGERAVVYVELPVLPSGVEAAFQGVRVAVDEGTVEQVREAFGVFSQVLDAPYDQPGTEFARRLWGSYADRIAEPALAGRRAKSKREAAGALAHVEDVMRDVQEDFAPIGQPTYEGREIVLGPRAGEYYLVRHGLAEGELVVTQGNFKIDAEVQIQAKPSMMTPAGGGGGGHDHGGGDGGRQVAGGQHAGHAVSLPIEFAEQLRGLEAAYQQIAEAMEQQDLGQVTAAFAAFGSALDAIDRSLLDGHPRAVWNEFAMLLGNDAVEGREVSQMDEADRIFLLLKGHMRRVREQLGIPEEEERSVEHIAVSPEFQAELAAVWERYLAIQQALAADDLETAQRALADLEAAVVAVDPGSIEGQAQEVWSNQQAQLKKLIDNLNRTSDIQAMRTTFLPLSEEIGVLAKAFGFGEPGSVYEIHCPMAFQGKGAIWYQDSDQVRNPYYGSTMLKCADRVEQIVRDEPAMPADQGAGIDHSQH